MVSSTPPILLPIAHPLGLNPVRHRKGIRAVSTTGGRTSPGGPANSVHSPCIVWHSKTLYQIKLVKGLTVQDQAANQFDISAAAMGPEVSG